MSPAQWTPGKLGRGHSQGQLGLGVPSLSPRQALSARQTREGSGVSRGPCTCTAWLIALPPRLRGGLPPGRPHRPALHRGSQEAAAGGRAGEGRPAPGPGATPLAPPGPCRCVPPGSLWVWNLPAPSELLSQPPTRCPRNGPWAGANEPTLLAGASLPPAEAWAGCPPSWPGLRPGTRRRAAPTASPGWTELRAGWSGLSAPRLLRLCEWLRVSCSQMRLLRTGGDSFPLRGSSGAVLGRVSAALCSTRWSAPTDLHAHPHPSPP